MNDISDHFEQLTSAIEMIQNMRNQEIDKSIENLWRLENNSNSNTPCTPL